MAAVPQGGSAMDYARFIDYFNQHDRFSVSGGMRLTQLG